MARIRAVLFDVDGTLLDSNDAQAHAWLDSLHGHGHDVSLARVRAAIGLPPAKLLREVANIDAAAASDRERAEARSIVDRQALLFRTHYLPDTGPFHGARMLVDRLRSRGLVCAALAKVTSSADVEASLRAAGVEDLIDTVVIADSAEGTFGGRDLVSTALDRIGILPPEALLIGDTRFDIELGRRAGVRVIAMRCGGSFIEREIAGAIAVYDDPASLSARLDSSPLALDRNSEPPPSPMKLPLRHYV